jgi:hypothetical protein
MTNRTQAIICMLLFAAGLVALIALAMTVPTAPASAASYRTCDWTGHCYRVQRARTHKPRRKYRRIPERDWTEWEDDMDSDRDRSPECLPNFVDVTSTEHTNEENGKEAATKMWMAKVQWHHGSKYMDLDNASNKQDGCSKSNAMDTMSGRISEATNKLIGQEGQNIRCVIIARPCRMVLKPAPGNDRLRSYR